MRRRLPLSFSLFLLVGCATGGADAKAVADAEPTAPDARGRDGSIRDGSVERDGRAGGDIDVGTGEPTEDAGVDPGGDGSTCTLGTANACRSCNDVCPGDGPGTERTCSGTGEGAACGYVCVGDYYDVDGQASNGCEIIDEPRQSTSATATTITLPNANDPNFHTNPLNRLGRVYSDDAPHQDPPSMRPLGVDDWYSVTAVGSGAPGGMGACLSIGSFPADNRFEVCITDPGETFLDPDACDVARGGSASVCVRPPDGGDAGGPYYIRVRKLEGSHSPNAYALYMAH